MRSTNTENARVSDAPTKIAKTAKKNQKRKPRSGRSKVDYESAGWRARYVEGETPFDDHGEHKGHVKAIGRKALENSSRGSWSISGV
ncbi:hypothetical protein P3342_001791 [Pyrenophora teres f. teres]|nr:hypothetical protein P3342_001791 [Pyrenophora teres f. teres]